MSWWDSQNFSDFASNALRNAQKKIDKVLDIQDENSKQKGLYMFSSFNFFHISQKLPFFFIQSLGIYFLLISIFLFFSKLECSECENHIFLNLNVFLRYFILNEST